MSTDFLLGLICGIALAFLYDQAQQHQHRKRRRIARREALKDPV